MKITTLASSALLSVSLSLVVGCGGGEAPAGSGSAAAKDGKPAAQDAPKDAKSAASSGKKEVELSPLPLKAQVDPSSKGAMDASRGDKKSVKLDVGSGVTLNVSETKESFADILKKASADKTVFPFKKFEKEEGMSAVWSFDAAGKTGYRGFTLLEIGGVSYECLTTGLDGAPSVDEVMKQLEGCKAIVAK